MGDCCWRQTSWTGPRSCRDDGIPANLETIFVVQLHQTRQQGTGRGWRSSLFHRRGQTPGRNTLQVRCKAPPSCTPATAAMPDCKPCGDRSTTKSSRHQACLMMQDHDWNCRFATSGETDPAGAGRPARPTWWYPVSHALHGRNPSCWPSSRHGQPGYASSGPCDLGIHGPQFVANPAIAPAAAVENALALQAVQCARGDRQRRQAGLRPLPCLRQYGAPLYQIERKHRRLWNSVAIRRWAQKSCTACQLTSQSAAPSTISARRLPARARHAPLFTCTSQVFANVGQDPYVDGLRQRPAGLPSRGRSPTTNPRRHGRAARQHRTHDPQAP